MIILVTGVSSGFGKAIAQALVANGHKVFGTVRRNVEILCISSIGGLIGLPYQGAYSASKFAMEGFCDALRLELLKSDVSVSLIEPGDFSTGFTATRKSVNVEMASDAYPSYSRSLASIENDENNGLKPDYLASRICRIVVLSRSGQRAGIFL